MPTTTAGTVTSSATSSITSTIQQLEVAYGPVAQETGHGAAVVYYSSLTTLEIISVIITAAFVVGIVIIIMKTGWLRVRLERIDDVILKSDVTKKSTQKSWSEVERHFFSGGGDDLKIAIMKADALLDDALREAGIRGANLGDRLHALTPEDLPDISHILEAHELRKRIARESDYVLKRDLAERALTVYERVLVHLGLLPEMPITEGVPHSETTTETKTKTNSESHSRQGPGSGSEPPPVNRLRR